jgi:acyl carrier protein
VARPAAAAARLDVGDHASNSRGCDAGSLGSANRRSRQDRSSISAITGFERQPSHLPTDIKDQGMRYCFTFSLYHAFSPFNEKAKQSMSTRLRIISAIHQIAVEQHVTLPPLNDDLSLHETGFDSLGFAILVARLEDDLGIDPFTISEDASFPLTIGDFIRAYENVPA